MVGSDAEFLVVGSSIVVQNAPMSNIHSYSTLDSKADYMDCNELVVAKLKVYQLFC